MNRAEALVFIATSLDGFIARSDGSLDWLMQDQATALAGEVSTMPSSCSA
ncbi:MAG: hypothetical protein U5L05_15100 [Rubrivivax sp.]|nr:hypothetical protein [Rubrivivax sp.]